MNKLNFNSEFPNKIVLCLGFFDCIHIGHRQIIAAAKKIAGECGAETAVFTFTNNPFEFLNKKAALIYSFDERVELLERLSVDNVVSVYFDDAFMHIPHTDFFELMIRNFNIAGLVCGNDYRSGSNGLGDVGYISDFCVKHNIRFCTVDDIGYLDDSGQYIKISSSIIRGLLAKGEIEQANKLLGSPYSVSGSVLSGRKEGRNINFPTVNLEFDTTKQNLKDGVYAVKVFTNGKYYFGVTNIGSKPTYEIKKKNIETHLIGFEGDLYGKTIRVEFYYPLRDIKKFNNVADLRTQIEKDKERALELLSL